MNLPTYGLIGRGRVARHLARYLELEGRSVASWHRNDARSPVDALRDADVLLLAISDDALEPFIAAHPELHDRPLVHFSGSLTVTGAHGLHPLMTFGPETYDLATYRAIPFVEERGGLRFDRVFPGLRNPTWSIDPDRKALYHALCVLAGNVTTVLWAKAMADFEARLELPGSALQAFLLQTATNTLAHGSAALTGSLARGDRGTVERDLAALDGDPFREVYVAVAHALDAQEVPS
jgi:predicted short-subunit dehydrogenase-like oxidoreductase (DUF2520 family)